LLEVVNLVLLHKNKILMVRDKKKCHWTLPGGKVERKDKTYKDAIFREVKEELKELEWKNPELFYDCRADTPHRNLPAHIIVFKGEYTGGNIENYNSPEITGSGWKYLDNKLRKPDSLTEIIDEVIRKYL